MVGSTMLGGRKELPEKREEEGATVMKEGRGRNNWKEKKVERLSHSRASPFFFLF